MSGSLWSTSAWSRVDSTWGTSPWAAASASASERLRPQAPRAPVTTEVWLPPGCQGAKRTRNGSFHRDHLDHIQPLDLVHHVHALGDAADHGVLARQLRAGDLEDEELAVGRLGLAAGEIGQRHDAA